ncbi:MAG: hypothetical protein ABIF87_11105 [Pseudomonadota bacterium]
MDQTKAFQTPLSNTVFLDVIRQKNLLVFTNNDILYAPLPINQEPDLTVGFFGKNTYCTGQFR